MYSYKGDIKFTEEPFVVALSDIILRSEHAFDIRGFGLESSKI